MREIYFTNALKINISSVLKKCEIDFLEEKKMLEASQKYFD